MKEIVVYKRLLVVRSEKYGILRIESPLAHFD